MRRGLLHLAALAACLAAGCGREAPKEAAPLRIVSTSAAATHILLALGAEEELAAIDSHGSIVPGAERIPVAGRGSVLSLEELTRLRVNRAVLWYYQRELAASLRDRGIAVTTVPPLRLGNYAELVQRLGGVDRPEAGSTEAGREISGRAAGGFGKDGAESLLGAVRPRPGGRGGVLFRGPAPAGRS